MRKIVVLPLAIAAAVLLSGCAKVQAPREIRIGGSDRPPPVDSGRVPRTSSHDVCRAELEKAYQNIQHLEREVSRWKDKADEYKRERDRCEDKLDDCKDRLEDCQDRLKDLRDRR